MHQILLTPLSASDHSWSTDDLLDRDGRARPGKKGEKSGKRRTMLDVASKLLSEQRTKWLRDRAATSRAPYPGTRKESKYGHIAQRGGVTAGYGLDDLKSAWAAGEKRVLDRDAEKKKARRHKWTVSSVPHNGRLILNLAELFANVQILIALGVLIICSVVVGVCVSLLANRHGNKSSFIDIDKSADSTGDATPSSTSSAARTTSSSATTYNVATCLEMFTLSASSSPSTYPCTQCVGSLLTATNDFTINGTSSTDVTGVGSALQFCALQTIFKNTDGVSTDEKATSSKANVLSGWMKDTDVCAGWTGIKCDNQGRIVSL